MIVDASIVVDALAGEPARAASALRALSEIPRGEPLIAPGVFAAEILSGLRACALSATKTFSSDDVPEALVLAREYGIEIESTPWTDVRRAHELGRASLRWTDALYVAAAERHRMDLLTSDARIGRSGAPMTCTVLTVR